MIEHMLSKHSRYENSFNSVNKEYSDALKLSRYNKELKYRKNESKDIRKRRRKFILFNPDFCRLEKKRFEIVNTQFYKNKVSSTN